MPQKQFVLLKKVFSMFSIIFTIFTLVHEFGHAEYIRKTTLKYRLKYEPSIILIGSEYAPMTKPKCTIKFKNYIIKFYKGDQGKGLTLSLHFSSFNMNDISNIAKAGYCYVKRLIQVLFIISILSAVPLFPLPISILVLILVNIVFVFVLQIFHDDFLKSSDYLYFSDPKKFDCRQAHFLYQAYAENQYDECHSDDPAT